MVGEVLGETDGVALIDESSVVKQGTESVGVAAQYCGSVGKTANGQVGVYLGYVSRKGYDTRNRLLDIVEVYHGAVNSSQVRLAEVFKPAIQRMAPAILVCHNHPSGDPNPSPDDVAVTRAMVQAGRLLDVDLLDHLVIGGSRYVSLKERGLGFS